MEVKTYPYGNANYTQNPDGSWAYKCQHGDRECTLNMAFACFMTRVENKVSGNSLIYVICHLPQKVFLNLFNCCIGSITI